MLSNTFSAFCKLEFEALVTTYNDENICATSTVDDLLQVSGQFVDSRSFKNKQKKYQRRLNPWYFWDAAERT